MESSVASAAYQIDRERSEPPLPFPREHHPGEKPPAFGQLTDGKYRRRTKERLPKKRAEMQPSIVIAHFPQVLEGSSATTLRFRGSTAGRLQSDAAPHRHAQAPT